MTVKSKKLFILVSVLLICVFVAAGFFSYASFGVANPFSAGAALAKVMFTDAKYAEAQGYPLVIIAKPDNAEKNLVEYMRSKGFAEDEAGRSGSVMRFENEVSAQYVQFSVNGYFSKWRWNE